MPKYQFFPKPLKNESIFSNYQAHNNYLAEHYGSIYDVIYKGSLNSDANKDFIKTTISNRLTVLNKLRDGYDYCDEIGGVIISPVFNLVAFSLIIKSLYHLVKYTIFLIKQDSNSANLNLTQARESIIRFNIGTISATINFLVSSVSLITRPVVTACTGWAPQEEADSADRFAYPSP